jgi:hypothetical protein
MNETQRLASCKDSLVVDLKDEAGPRLVDEWFLNEESASETDFMTIGVNDVVSL